MSITFKFSKNVENIAVVPQEPGIQFNIGFIGKSISLKIGKLLPEKFIGHGVDVGTGQPILAFQRKANIKSFRLIYSKKYGSKFSHRWVNTLMKIRRNYSVLKNSTIESRQLVVDFLNSNNIKFSENDYHNTYKTREEFDAEYSNGIKLDKANLESDMKSKLSMLNDFTLLFVENTQDNNIIVWIK